MLLFRLNINSKINISDILIIKYFTASIKSKNDEYNKQRENIIIKCINDKNSNLNINDYLINFNTNYDDYKAIKKAGRNNNYDFDLLLYKNNSVINTFKIEFKFNCKLLSDNPQFVSPMNINKFLDNSYEEYFYDNYLKYIVYPDNLPNKLLYLKQINSISPECMKQYQEKYYKGCIKSSKYIGKEYVEYYELCNKVSKDSIIEFIKLSKLKVDVLNEYINNTQSNKHYMMYLNGTLYYDTNPNIKIISYTKNKNKYECLLSNNKTIKILLRYKNGNGIAYPAFQIS